MATITTRAGKGSPLTNSEVDANFNNLNTDKLELGGGAMTGAITTNSTFDGRDVSVDGAKLDTVATSANNYTHPSAHAISFITGLQTALDGKIDDSQVLTNVPSGALFTDTNTQRAIHDTPSDGATTTSISSNWAFDNVKTAVPSGALFTDTNTTYTSSDFNHDNLTGFVANEHINWTGASAGTIHLTNLPATAITSVQTASSQAAMLALTTEEGDVVVRSDESKTYMHNGGTASSMADFTLLATPTDAVASVDGATGVITLNHDNLTGFVANEHIDWTADQGSTNIHTGNYTNTVYTLPFTDNSGNWNTAYGWGNHSTQGYLTAATVTSANNGTLTISTSGSASGGGTFSANQSSNNTITITGATIPTSLPANGGNADTLDNIDSSQFVRSDANDTLSGQYTFSKVNDHAIRVGTIRGTVVGSRSGEYIQMYNRVHIGSPAGWGSRDAPTYGLSTYGGADLATDTGSVTISGSTAWHAGNDGSGSGLDADLLDGVDSTVYFKSPSNVSGWQNSNANFSVRSGSSAVGLHMEESDGTFGFQLYGDSGYYGFLDAEWANWDIQKNVNGAFKVDEGSGLKRVLNEANWSSYISIPTSLPANGGNADTVDSLHAASFARSDASDTLSGDYAFTGGHGAINITSSSIVSNASSTWTGNPGSQGKIQYHSNRWYIVSDSSSSLICQFRRDGADVSYIDNSGTYVGNLSGTASYASNSNLLDGLDLHNTQGTQNSANQVLRTQVNGYSMLGWINTTSGATSSTLTRIYCSEDGYIRYQTPATFGASISPHINYNSIANKPTIPTSLPANGGNADTVDGQHASAFVGTHNGHNRNIQAEVGALHFYQDGGNSGQSNHSYAIFQESGAWSSPYPDLRIAYHTGIKLGAYIGYGGTRFYSNSDMATELFSVGNGDNHVRVAYNLYRGGNLVWDAGNDGANSTLDSDLLDGQHGAYYLASANFTGRLSDARMPSVIGGSQGTTFIGTFTGAASNGSGVNYLLSNAKAADSDLFDGHNSDRFVFGTSGYGTTHLGFGSITNQKSGFYDMANSGTPTGTWYSLVNMAHYGANHGHQIAGSFYSAGDIYNRNNNNTSLSSWAKIWNTANDGVSSGLVADYAGRVTFNTQGNSNTTLKLLLGDTSNSTVTAGTVYKDASLSFNCSLNTLYTGSINFSNWNYAAYKSATATSSAGYSQSFVTQHSTSANAYQSGWNGTVASQGASNLRTLGVSSTGEMANDIVEQSLTMTRAQFNAMAINQDYDFLTFSNSRGSNPGRAAIIMEVILCCRYTSYSGAALSSGNYLVLELASDHYTGGKTIAKFLTNSMMYMTDAYNNTSLCSFIYQDRESRLYWGEKPIKIRKLTTATLGSHVTSLTVKVRYKMYDGASF